MNIHAAFVVHAADTEAYLDLIRTPAKTVIQTGQVGAIILADALMVSGFLAHPYFQKPQPIEYSRSIARLLYGTATYMLS